MWTSGCRKKKRNSLQLNLNLSLNYQARVAFINVISTSTVKNRIISYKCNCTKLKAIKVDIVSLSLTSFLFCWRPSPFVDKSVRWRKIRSVRHAAVKLCHSPFTVHVDNNVTRSGIQGANNVILAYAYSSTGNLFYKYKKLWQLCMTSMSSQNFKSEYVSMLFGRPFAIFCNLVTFVATKVTSCCMQNGYRDFGTVHDASLIEIPLL